MSFIEEPRWWAREGLGISWITVSIAERTGVSHPAQKDGGLHKIPPVQQSLLEDAVELNYSGMNSQLVGGDPSAQNVVVGGLNVHEI